VAVTRIGVIADTHGKLDPLVESLFAGVDHVIHAGDIGGEAILERLRAIAPLTAVAGNIDGFSCGDAGVEASVEIGGAAIYVIHIVGRPRRPEQEVRVAIETLAPDLIVFGHSHLPHDEIVDGVLFFNPASAGPRRFDYPRAVGIIEIDRGRPQGRHIPLDERSAAALEVYMNALSAEADGRK
jgi:uncharacterized protein